jgi:hypothetical protein
MFDPSRIVDGNKAIIDELVFDVGQRPRIEAQTAVNVARGFAPLEKDRTEKDVPLAIVGYGPSLQDTWERLRDWPGPIWTVSKAHDFLLERGIVPTYHTDVDGGEEKVHTIQKPDPRVTYIMATKMFPAVLDGLPKENVRLFHVQIYPGVYEAHQRLDPRYPAFKVAFDTSVQAAEIAFQRRFYDQHWFGVDYGMPEGELYAGPHEGPAHTAQRVQLDGRVYLTSTLMMSGLLMAEQWRCRRAPVSLKIHGNGLLGTFLTARRRCRVEIRP